jgi:hypothetical protein
MNYRPGAPATAPLFVGQGLMRYSTVIFLTQILFCGLAVGLLGAPGFFASRFGLDPSVGAEVMARRAGVIFVALALLFHALRRVEEPGLQRAVARAGVVMMGGLIALGLIEWAAGRVGPGILFAVLPEAIYAALYAPIALRKG